MSEVIAIFGGTFSPPHLGHVRAAEAFATHVAPNKLLIIPTYVPPHKEYHHTVSCEDRLEMCRIAFSHIPNVEISDMEIARGGKSYTADTLELLASPNRELAFLCGTDMMLTLDRWYDPDRIFRLCSLYCIRREGSPELERQIEEANQRYFERFGKRVIMIDAPWLEVSSSEIRECLSQGNGHHLLPKAVEEFIIERGLYQ